MRDVVDLQFQILEWVYSSPRDGYGLPATLATLANQFSATWDDVIDAMELLARRKHVQVARPVPTRGIGFDWECYGVDAHDIRPFLDGLGCRLFPTADGRERLAILRRRRAMAALPPTGDAGADEAVRQRVEELLQGRQVDDERRQVLARLLGRLAWIGAHSYCDDEYLVKRAFEAFSDRPGRADLERRFYQPFLYRELRSDSLLAPHLTKGPEQAGGLCDLLCMTEFAIEAKVVYPDGTPAEAERIGIAQATQYAARSGIAFLAVLDMRPRDRSTELGQVANDVSIIPVGKRDGPTPVRIARVQHVVGHGPPSRARL